MRRYALRAVASALLVSLAAGCAGVAPLDDAELTGLALASSEDLARYDKAKERRARETFGSASFSDGRGNTIASFGADEYDEYQAYLRDHPEKDPYLGLKTALQKAMPAWPTISLTFQSTRALFDTGEASFLTVAFFLCDEESGERRLYGFGMPDVMWRDRFVGEELAQEIEEAQRSEAQPQEYEVFFDYVHWNQEEHLQEGAPAKLLPLPGDLCLALDRPNYPFPSRVGRPLRTDKNVVNEALAPLPRPLSIP